MLLFVLGILDLLAGVILMAAGAFPLTENGLAFMLGAIAIAKGVWSVLTAMAAGFYFDFLGIIDFFVGLFLLLSVWGFYLDFFFYVGIVAILKGLYSFFVGWVSP
ncbi:MAG: hypothetical protein HY367_02760 [Candidatus Aenigmarchaeota archaeon]|nr:hypothetical protein [Candidatus Aenigmarchaeota archaeon]